MRYRTISLCAFGLLLASTSSLFAQTGRYVQENGTLYHETWQTIRRPVTETQVQERQQTVYREQVTTENLQTQQLTHTPVTTYQWEARWHNTWNPFGQPYVTYHWTPRTHWQTEARTVEVPVTRREWVPETKTVQVPVTTTRFEEQTQVSRVAVGPAPATAPLAFVPAQPSPPTEVARREEVGGIRDLDEQPPRLDPSTLTR